MALIATRSAPSLSHFFKLGLFCYFAISISQVPGAVSEKPELNILGLFSMTGDQMLDGNAGKLIVDVAIEQINNRTDILPNHKLKLFWRDSQCTVGSGVNGLYDLLYTPPVKHMILGESCSIVCEPVAEVSPRWNISQLAFGCSSSTLSNKQKYPLFFRTIVPDTSYTAPKVEMMRAFGWTKIATIHQSYEIFSAATNDLLDELPNNNVTVLLSASFLTDPVHQVDNLKKHDARIIFSGFYENAAREAFCEAYMQGMYGPKYAWLGVYWYSHDWWKSAEVDTDCTAAELLEAIDGMLYMGMTFENPLNEKGLSGVNYTGLMELYDEAAQGREISGREKVPTYYDALWTVALALDKAVTALDETGHQKNLEDFTYKDSDIGTVMTESMANIDFQGVMGRMKFDENGDPPRITAIDQQQDDKRVLVGYYQPSTETTEGKFVWINEGIKWPGGHPPRDATIEKLKHVYISKGLYGTMCTLAAVGMVITAVFFVFNVKYRKHSLVRLASPNINNVILIGCLLVYCTVFLRERRGSGVKEEFFCVCRNFVFLIGFSLALGALFSKTWRVHKLFTMSSKRLAKVVVKDTMLIGIVLALVLVNVLILVIWQAADPLDLKIKNLDKEVSSVDEDVVTIPQLHTCSSDHDVYFIGVLYVLQGMMLAFGAFLAWETRNVEVKALNDSKQIGVCIYIVLTLSVLGVAVSLLSDDDIDVSYGFTSGIVIVGTTLIQCIIFVPKMLGVKRGGPVVVVKHANNAVSETQGSNLDSASDDDAANGPTEVTTQE